MLHSEQGKLLVCHCQWPSQILEPVCSSEHETVSYSWRRKSVVVRQAGMHAGTEEKKNYIVWKINEICYFHRSINRKRQLAETLFNTKNNLFNVMKVALQYWQKVLKFCFDPIGSSDSLKIMYYVTFSSFWFNIIKYWGKHYINFRFQRYPLSQSFWSFQKKILQLQIVSSVTSKKSPNVHKTCPNVISLEKFQILTPLQNCIRIWEIWAN